MNTLRLSLLSLIALMASLFALPAQAAPIEGQDYTVLSNPENILGNKIVVREFFWYGCGHCYNLEPYSQAYDRTKPKDVAFYQTPAALNPVWEANARGFYSVQFLNQLPQVHQKTFDAIHKGNKRIFDQKSLSDFYGSLGVDTKKFNQLYNSFAVSTKVGKSKAAAQRYQLTGVPAVVVHGKYLVKGEGPEVFQTVNYLVDKVRTEMKP